MLSSCAHNRSHEIGKGELRFVITEPGPAGAEKGYCTICAIAMLEASTARIRELSSALSE